MVIHKSFSPEQNEYPPETIPNPAQGNLLYTLPQEAILSGCMAVIEHGMA
jgi:hypothetical protein